VSAAIASGPTLAANSVRALLRLLTAVNDTAARLAALGPPRAGGAGDAAEGAVPVEIYASQERLRLGAEQPVEVTLALRVRDGYHLTAADPGPGGAGLIPLRVGIINGTGVAAYADYPEGEAYGPQGDLRVYRGEAQFTVALERSGDWSGRPLLAVTYQACTDTECLAPVTAELDIAIDRAD
jgi:hypothetical protein